jgi:hypothetical protein
MTFDGKRIFSCDAIDPIAKFLACLVRSLMSGLNYFVGRPIRRGTVGTASPPSEGSPEQRLEYNQTNRHKEAHWWLTQQQLAQINQ